MCSCDAYPLERVWLSSHQLTNFSAELTPQKPNRHKINQTNKASSTKGRWMTESKFSVWKNDS